MKQAFLFVVLTTLSLSPAYAGDAQAGKTKAALCTACHGVNGISPSDIWPNLAGQKKGYLIKQIKAFRSGERKDPTMSPMAMPLDDKAIEDIATYFSGLKPQ